MLDDAPPLLGLRGALEASMRPMIAIVGSRNASGAGLKFAGQLARDLGEAGFVIVSGLARGIDQAAHRSGSLITARMAAEQGREVFAVPGSPLDPRAAGANDLIKQGATLVTEAADVIHAVEPIMERPVAFPLSEPDGEPLAPDPNASDRARITSLLGPSPVSIDDLIRMAGTSPALVRTVLLELELAGRLERHGGGLVSLI